MTREELVRECLVLTCFLENIDTNHRVTIARLLEGFEMSTLNELQRYYEINSEIKNLRYERLVANAKSIKYE